jgi:hypothetical protein
MPEPFEHPEATKPDDKAVSEATADKRIDRVAEKAAEKSTQPVQSYDEDHKIIAH